MLPDGVLVCYWRMLEGCFCCKIDAAHNIRHKKKRYEAATLSVICQPALMLGGQFCYTLYVCISSYMGIWKCNVHVLSCD